MRGNIGKAARIIWHWRCHRKVSHCLHRFNEHCFETGVDSASSHYLVYVLFPYNDSFLSRYNTLIEYIQKSLIDVKRAIQGQITMIPTLETVHKAMSIGKLPDAWASKSYPSLKPLGSYINDLLARLSFFQSWIDDGEPAIHWISGFYFTQSFLTAVMQNHSRKNDLPIDQLRMKFDFTSFDVEDLLKPQFGVYIKVSEVTWIPIHCLSNSKMDTQDTFENIENLLLFVIE